MTQQPGRSLHLIVNAKARDDESLRAAVEAVRGRGHRVEVRATDQVGDAERLAAEAARAGAETVVAVGGDGTLNEVVNGVARAAWPVRCAVGVVPLGTANDFAGGCQIPRNDPAAALDL